MLVYICTCTYTRRCTNPNQASLWALRFGPPAQIHTQKEQKHDCISLVSTANTSSTAKMRKALIRGFILVCNLNLNSTLSWGALSRLILRCSVLSLSCLIISDTYTAMNCGVNILCTQMLTDGVAIKRQVWLDMSPPNTCRLPCTRTPS